LVLQQFAAQNRETHLGVVRNIRRGGSLEMPGEAKPASDQERRPRQLLRAIEDWLFGYDFFVSYQWSSGGKYAKALAEALERVGFECFLDRSDFAVGDDWKEESRRALHRTESLIVIATREALRTSTAVQLELDVFGARQRRILPIVFGELFTEAERKEIPALERLPPTMLATLEPSSAVDGKPSKQTIDAIASSFHVLRTRRRQKRALVATLVTLVGLLTVVSALAVVTAVALKREKQQRETAMARQLLAHADLLRETDGPQLSNSLADAVHSYRFAEQAGISTRPARLAIEQALAITPIEVGTPWKPFEHPKCIEIHPLHDRLVALNTPCANASSGQAVEVAVASIDEKSGWKTLVPAFQVPIDAVRNNSAGVRQLVLSNQDGNATLLDLATGQKNSLPFDSQNVVAISAEGNAALVAAGGKIEYWTLGTDPGRRQILEGVTNHAWLSNRGRWIAWDQPGPQCHHLMIMSMSDGAKGVAALTFYGPQIAVSFPEVPEDLSAGGERSPEPFVVTAVWPENQVVQALPGIDSNSPRWRGAVWLDKKHFYTGEAPDAFALGTSDWTCDERSSPLPPSSEFARPDEVEVNLGFVQGSRETWIAIVDALGPPHLMNVESGVPIIPMSSAGGARHGSFSRDAAWFIGVYADKTARLWRFGRDVDASRSDIPQFTASERLRFTAKQGINDAAFLGDPTSNDESLAGIVTSDLDGNIQLWASHPTTKTADDVLRRDSAL
jgi:hypothetical protein